MGWTKRQFVVEAYNEIGYAQNEYDLESEQLDRGLRRLDAMLATWNAKGIRLGYPLSSSPELSSLDTETNVPDSAQEAVYTNLALRLSPPVGKTVSLETRQIARETYRTVLQRATAPRAMQFPTTLPAGAGNKTWRYDDPFIKQPEDPIDVGPDGELSFD